MEYRKVNDEAMRASIMHEDARVREHDAFLAELEVSRHKRLSALAGDEHKALREAAEPLAKKHEATATSLRAVADRRAKETSLTPVEVARVHHDILDGWVMALEREHVGKLTELDLVEGRDKEAKERRQTLREELVVIEDAHAMAVEMLDDAAAELGEDFPESPFEDLTVKELRELASDHDIEGYSGMKKDDLVEALTAQGVTP